MYLDTIVYSLQLLKSDTVLICINNNNRNNNNHDDNNNNKKNTFHLCWIRSDTDVNYHLLTNIIVDHNKIETSELHETE